MSYQALYRVWRPQRFQDLVGQEAVTKTLSHAIQSGKTSHAYLFTGPRGTGKTSAAKIFAKAINCPNQTHGEPCNTCDICRAITEGTLSDVVEIDAASNNGVEEIREIRDKARYAPTEAEYKVYIIDEVHMLSTGAFNALLKTLEEPPANVIFILATTEPHKIPATIISRTQRFDFKRIDHQTIEKRLAYILEQEEIAVEPGSLAVIARAANGGMRDALSLLDQVISFSDGEITLQLTREITGTLSEEQLLQYITALLQGEMQRALTTLQDLLSQGQDAKRFVEEQLLFARDLLMSKEMDEEATETLTQRYDEAFFQLGQEMSVSQILVLMDAFKQTQSDIRFTLQADIYLEIVTVQLAHDLPTQSQQPSEITSNETVEANHQVMQELASLKSELADLKQSIAKGDSNPTTTSSSELKKRTTSRHTKFFKPNYTQIYQVLNQATRPDLDQLNAVWTDLIASLPNMQAALLKQTQPAAASPKGFVIQFAYDILCQKVADDTEVQAVIENHLENMLGHQSKMYVLTQEQWQETRQHYVTARKEGRTEELLTGEATADEDATPEAMTQDHQSDHDWITEDDNQQADDIAKQAVDLFGEESVTIVDD